MEEVVLERDRACWGPCSRAAIIVPAVEAAGYRSRGLRKLSGDVAAGSYRSKGLDKAVLERKLPRDREVGGIQTVRGLKKTVLGGERALGG